MNSEYYMRMALDLAKKGMGYTSPNPMVGAVIVKNGKVIGKGYHHKYGDLHGERDALANATDDVTGAIMYVTLEPCCHKGKQPPCVEAIIQAGIKKVFVGSDDPNPLVAGKGIKILLTFFLLLGIMIIILLLIRQWQTTEKCTLVLQLTLQLQCHSFVQRQILFYLIFQRHALCSTENMLEKMLLW